MAPPGETPAHAVVLNGATISPMNSVEFEARGGKVKPYVILCTGSSKPKKVMPLSGSTYGPPACARAEMNTRCEYRFRQNIVTTAHQM